MRNNEQGRSMIEMLGVLAIVGVLSVGGITGYSKAMNKFKTNKLNDQVNMIITNVRTLFSSQRTYEGLTNGTAIQAGIIPEEMYEKLASDAEVSSNHTITNPFNGGVYLGVANAKQDEPAEDKKAFVVGIDNVPATICVSIVTTDWGGSTSSGLLAMYAGQGDDVDAQAAAEAIDTVAEVDGAGDGVAGVRDLPFSIISATTNCGRTGTSAIAWKFE